MISLAKIYRGLITESRDDSFADYEVKKDKVFAYLKKQKASAFTRLADRWNEFDKLQNELADKKRKLNDELNSAKEIEDKLKDEIREKVISVFDDSEQAMSLAVHCLNSTFTVSKLSGENQPQTVAKQGDYIDTDYKKVVELLIEQNKDLSDSVNLLIKQCSTLAVEDIVKPGAKRRLRVDVGESKLTENLIWDKIVNIYNKISNVLTKFFSRLNSRRSQIDKQLMLLVNK